MTLLKTKLNNYKELIVWQKAIELAVKVYQEMQNYPQSEKFALPRADEAQFQLLRILLRRREELKEGFW